ncbi:class I SAM-dependent methyltransferase [Sulfurimonas sp.]
MKVLKYIKNIRLFDILYEGMNFYNQDVKHIILSYIDNYIIYKNLNETSVKKYYENFVRQYSQDIKFYFEYSTYPAVKNGITYDISRMEYDVFLLFSTVLTQHRYKIMCEIYENLHPSRNALVIGLGIGIELELMQGKYQYIDAYDIKIDSFCQLQHPNVNFFEKEFIKNNETDYDDIYIIELLEHIEQPYLLLENVLSSLKPNGRLIITLAINIPQFDHLYNFNKLEFCYDKLESIGLMVSYSEEIKHQYLLNDLDDSSNIFMILKKL